MMTSAGYRELRGSMTALVTPFRNGDVDWPAVNTLVDRQVEGGTDWLVPCGTTGESPTLTGEESAKMLEAVLARADGRCRVMAGTGSNNTAEAVRKTRSAWKAGAHAAMLVAPYYNRPTPEGLFRHFAAVAEAVDIPIVLYNVPIRTGVTIDNDVIARLRDGFSHIVAVKDATGDLDGVTDLLNRCDIAVLCGDDALAWPMMAVGAVGVISVISNVCPALVKSLVSAATAGRGVEALRLHRKLFDLASSLGRFGPNPVPIKTALAVQGVIADEFRLPLCPLGADARAGIENVLRRHEIIEPEVP